MDDGGSIPPSGSSLYFEAVDKWFKSSPSQGEEQGFKSLQPYQGFVMGSSSNGRTAVFQAAYIGSTPLLPTKGLPLYRACFRNRSS